MAKVKICGISHDVEIGIMNELNPDYVGFVFASKSKRFIAPEHAGYLRAKLKRSIKAVGVFENAKLEQVALAVETAGLDMIQLRGAETGEYIAALREYTRCPIIRSFKVNTAMDAERAMYTTADYVMLDGGEGGGHTFDWSFIGSSKRRAYFLKGGLTPDNIQQALDLSPQPFALDVSTGVESSRLKDYRKCMKFILAVRNYKGRNA
ncbi:MAG: phosphoribosylanthranilate isomerase [Synergistaceae bacterium]|nr:phosphoribosylanthranilate isomerase [Synergistaceae bacterium]